MNELSTSSSVPSSSTSQIPENEYEVLIHALSNEHTKNNIDRHVKVLDRWLRIYAKGFFLRDLKSIITIMKILKERLTTHTELFQPILTDLLKVCGMPLYETKANERLTASVQTDMKDYYSELALFWDICNFRTKINLASTFRTIVNGGIDPKILRVDVVPYEMEEDRQPVIDKVLNQEILRDCGVVEVIVHQYLIAVSQFKNIVGDASLDAASYMPSSDIVVEGSPTNSGNNTASHVNNASIDDTAVPMMQIGADDDSDDEGFNNQLAASTSVIEGEGATGTGVHGTQEEGAVSNSLTDLSSAVLTMSNDSAMYAEAVLVFLKLCFEMGEYEESALLMCNTGVCKALLDTLAISARENLRDERVSITMDLLWTCLEMRVKASNAAFTSTNGHSDARKQLGSLDILDFSLAVPLFRNLLLRLLFEGYRLADKECRNEVIILLTLCANFPQSLPAFLSCDLISTLVTYACVGEATIESWAFFDVVIAKQRNFATIFDVDIQFKSSLWMLLQDLIDTCDPDIMTCVGSSPLLDTLIKYTEADSTDEGRKAQSSTATQKPSTDVYGINGTLGEMEGGSLLPYPRVSPNMSGIPEFPPLPGNEPLAPKPPRDMTPLNNWFNSIPISELRSLQVLSMNMLSKSSTVLMGEFLRVDGPLRVLETIHKYADSTQEEHKALVQNALLTLTRCLMSSNRIKTILERQDFIRIILHIFRSSDEEESRTQALRLISIMCNESEENQRQFRIMNGAQLIVDAMQVYNTDRSIQVGRRAGIKVQGLIGDQLDNDGGDAPPIAIAMLDVIHKGIIRNRANEASFAQVEGVDALLDMLEVADFLLRLKVLRILADILENQRLVAYAVAWRSRLSMRPAAQLITHSWLDEEARLQASRDNGVICNIWDPLGDHRWPTPEQGRKTMGDTASDSSLGGVNKLALGAGTVTKLMDDLAAATKGGAISASVRDAAMQRDTRGILASILQLLGLLDEDLEKQLNDVASISNYSNENRSINENNGNGAGESNFLDLSQDAPIDPADDANGMGLEEDTSLGFSESRSSNAESELSVKLVTASKVNLDPTDKQVLSLARRYDIIRIGEWWVSVAEDMENSNVKLIEEDSRIIEHNLRESFDASAAVQLEQLELKSELQRLSNAQNDAFVGGILEQKQQQIKAEWLKKKARLNVNR